MKSSIVFEVMRDKTETVKKYGAAFAGFIHSHLIPVMRGKMKYEEYYKQASAAVSYCELGRDEFPQFDDIFVDCHKEGKTVDECVEIWDDCVNEYVQEKCL
jgi:hypothetical protein